MFTLTMTREVYSRTESGKSWRTKPDEVETESLPWYHLDAQDANLPNITMSWGEHVHRNITADDTLAFFRRLGGSEYAERSYTPVGHIVTRLVSSNPDRTLRVVRKFRITDV